MNYTAINIQGNIISSEILEKIRTEDIKYQQAGDFGLDKKVSVRDEIGLAWAAARAHWTAFQLRVNRLQEGESGAGETRNSWMIPLLRELGYDVEKAPAFIHPDTQKSYAISHKAGNRTCFPIHIMGVNDSLDKRREGSGPRLSPHALTQEYLNNTDHLYALVTNGKTLRLLRDATRLVRLSYIEFDLSRIMEEELYAEFAILFRLLHVTRMPVDLESTEESYIEYYHQESLSTGSRIREKLSEAVEKSIKTLANGFLGHPENTELRDRIQQGVIPASAFYLYQLRLIYRFLFLIVTEERNLISPPLTTPTTPPIPPPTRGGDLARLRKIYYEYYSIERLRKLSRKLLYVDGRKHDLWEGLINTFLLFEKGFYGEKLGIKPLGAGLFSSDALGILPECKLDNKNLLQVISLLTQFENDQRQLVDVNYSDLDVEEFGSVYEGLLEYDAHFGEYEGKPRFEFVEGTGRSTSGSHYTPEELVKPLIKHSLEYIIEDKLKEPDKEKALLSITVCDVACGSGHILLSAARRIALELARVRTNEEQPSPTAIRTAIRDVIKNCIYGVDKNPLAVELCKVALWLESHNPGEPLNFLDHRIKCGDSIVGLVSQDELKKGIPNEAFKGLPGDDKTVASRLLKINKQERKTPDQLYIDFENQIGKRLKSILHTYDEFSSLPETTPLEIQQKEKAYKNLTSGSNWYDLRILADMMIAPFFISKTIENEKSIATDGAYRAFLRGAPLQGQIPAKAQAMSVEKNFFHWFLEFPEVFTKGGFDCVLGNP
ncbi:MAG: N-6 DNA methylase, partial [Bacteroidales bacterium]|nr:N-6 DNA methylase [Bacteroidales bacterium]